MISFHLLTGPLAQNLSLLSAKSNFDDSKRSSVILKVDNGTFSLLHGNCSRNQVYSNSSVCLN